jgi:thiamine-phosphate diphosphorylase
MRAMAPLPRLHIVTDDAVLAAPAFTAAAMSLVEVGGARIALHLRGHGTGGAALFALATQLKRAADATGATLFVNDRVDVALAAGLEAVQLGRRSLAVGTVRALLPRATIGVSVHSLAEIAEAHGTDLVLAGTIYESASHAGAAPAGIAFVRAAGGLGRPVIAIGGVRPEHVAELLAAGAHGVAVLGGIWYAADGCAALNTYMAAFDAACGSDHEDERTNIHRGQWRGA